MYQLRLTLEKRVPSKFLGGYTVEGEFDNQKNCL